MLLRLLFVTFTFLIPGLALACPGCVGSDPKAAMNVVYTIMIFIALVYIPFFLLYRMIIKNKNAHMIGREEALESSTSNDNSK